jgi:hypothetical protein
MQQLDQETLKQLAISLADSKLELHSSLDIPTNYIVVSDVLYAKAIDALNTYISSIECILSFNGYKGGINA